MAKLGYVRVSTDKQTTRLQEDALAAAGVESNEIFRDTLSGNTYGPHRPGLAKLLAHARAGDTVVVWRVDRLGRSLIDSLNTVDLLLEKQIKIVSVVEGIDPSTSTGRMMLSLMSTLAEYERNLIRERSVAGIVAAKARGVPLGRPRKDRDVMLRKTLICLENVREHHMTSTQAASMVGWSRPTFYRWLSIFRESGDISDPQVGQQ